MSPSFTVARSFRPRSVCIKESVTDMFSDKYVSPLPGVASGGSGAHCGGAVLGFGRWGQAKDPPKRDPGPEPMPGSDPHMEGFGPEPIPMVLRDQGLFGASGKFKIVVRGGRQNVRDVHPLSSPGAREKELPGH